MKRFSHRWRQIVFVVGPLCWLAAPARLSGQAANAPTAGVAKGVVEGRIRQAGSGVGLAGKLAVFKSVPELSGGGTGVLGGASTDSEGYYRVEIKQGERLDELCARAEGHISSRRRVGLTAPGHAVLNFELTPDVPASGFLVDTAGQPIEGATVRVVYPDEETMSGIGEEMGNVETNALGRFDLPYVKAVGRFLLEVTKPGYVPAFSSELAGAGKRMENLVVHIDLKRGATLKGTVLDEAGRPVSLARVSVQRAEHIGPKELVSVSMAVSRSRYTWVETSDDGRFSFSGLAEGPITVVASDLRGEPKKLQSWIWNIAPTDETKEVTFILKPWRRP